MSQIRAKSLTNIRGRAYKCLHCRGANPCIGEKKRIESHIYKNHISLEKSPFYCKLCMFRCTEQEDLERHVLTFKAHRDRAANQPDDFDEEENLLKSDDPYYITQKDMVCLSVEESEKVWERRKKFYSATTSPVSPPFPSPPAVLRQLGTPTQDENVWDSIMGPAQYSVGMSLSPPSLPLRQTSASMPVTTATQMPLSPPTASVASLPSMQSFVQPVLPQISSSTTTLPFSPPTASDASLPTVQSYVQPVVPQIPLSTATLSFSSPFYRNVYNPLFPAIDHNSYEPTPVSTSVSVTPSASASVSTTCTSAQTDDSTWCKRDQLLVNAIDGLGKNFKDGMASIAKAMENQTLLLSALSQHVKSFVRYMEEDTKKRRRDEEPRQQEKIKDYKRARH